MERETGEVEETASYHAKIREWPADERPRERLLRHGAQLLSDTELLAILIQSGTGRITAVDIAKTLLKEFRSLTNLVTRTLPELRRFKGIGSARSAVLLAAFELGRRVASRPRLDRLQIRSPEDVVRVYLPLMRDLKQEIFTVVLLDSANHILREVKITEGILNSSLVHPREVFRPAILEPAASIILIHNHPSGNPEPSREDLQVTRQIVDAGKIIGITVHDHIIIAEEGHTSFAERGLL